MSNLIGSDAVHTMGLLHGMRLVSSGAACSNCTHILQVMQLHLLFQIDVPGALHSCSNGLQH
jgi:bisphosphoglycerate-independent phosphoglycerate mutase (AlkP superfamily)